MDPESKELGTVLPHMPDGTPSLVRLGKAMYIEGNGR